MSDHSAIFRKPEEKSEKVKCIERVQDISADLDSLHRITSDAGASADTGHHVDQHSLFVAASLLAKHAEELDAIYCTLRD